jgi:hypothetical protein
MGRQMMATYGYEEDFIAAARNLKSAGFDSVTMMSPIPLHDAEAVLELGKSPVRRFSLAGAITGAIGGFALATFSALSFIQPAGGRPLITIPPFLVITYEMTILLGVLATLLGFHFVSGLPAWKDAPYSIVSSEDKFTVVVDVIDDGDPAEARRILENAGAESIRNLEEFS